MKLTARQTKYGYKVLDCPFCKEYSFYGYGTKYNPAKKLQFHIRAKAKTEAFLMATSNMAIPTPHLDYYLEHTLEVVISKNIRREFDSDLQVMEE